MLGIQGRRIFVGNNNVRRFSSSNNETILRSWLFGDSSNNLPAPAKDFDTFASSCSRLSIDNKSQENVITVELNRPSKLNSFDMQMWQELEQVFQHLRVNDKVSPRAVILRGNGPAFSTGMDLEVFQVLNKLAGEISCEARKREKLGVFIDRLQRIISAPEHCRVPVIAEIQGYCLGGAVDLITACDLRYCDAEAEFSVKEIDLAIVADIGTLQRLPLIVGEQEAKELSYTGRHFFGAEAEKNKLVLKCMPDTKSLRRHVTAVTNQIAAKSPVTIRGIKESIQYRRDHTTEDSLRQVRYWNSSMLYSNDLERALVAMTSKSTPKFEN